MAMTRGLREPSAYRRLDWSLQRSSHADDAWCWMIIIGMSFSSIE